MGGCTSIGKQAGQLGIKPSRTVKRRGGGDDEEGVEGVEGLVAWLALMILLKWRDAKCEEG